MVKNPAQERQAPTGDQPPLVGDIDVIYRETDRLYHLVARGCGLSDAAYWTLVKVAASGGSCTQADVADEYAYTRQTVNSAVKFLLGKGYVRLAYKEGSRRNKAIMLTPEGGTFCEENIYPALEAESRAFESLTPQDRAEFVRLVHAYAAAIERELGQLGLSGTERAQ